VPTAITLPQQRLGGRTGRRLLQAVLGGDADRRVLPVVPITFIYNASFSTFWVYVGVFAVKGLGWRPGAVGILFLLTAPPAAVANYASGRISDRFGRKTPIVASFLASTANISALAVLRDYEVTAFALIIVQGVVGAPAYSLDRVLVADLVADQDAREAGYAAVRVASNLGVFVGPPLAAVLIATAGWTAFLVALAVFGLVGAAVTTVVLPTVTPQAERAPVPGRPGRLMLGDRPFVLLLSSVLLGFFIYCGFETVLPVVAVSAYGLAPATWGLLVMISPLLVVLFQLRLTRAGAQLSTGLRLALATLLMGLPFLLLIVQASVAVLAAVIVVFVLGEMLWMPTSQAVAAKLAPAALRGRYFGALSAMTGPAWTLAPFLALELRAHVGVASVWTFFALVALAGAATGFAAARAADERPP
jgi:predicted MFS family arabinose efflux permease